MSDYYYKADQVRELAEKDERWLDVLATLAPDSMYEAIAKPGKHVSCPVHGGKHKDAFRLFKDAHRTGGAVCNTCGPRHDGFELLMWLKGWSFEQCLLAVGDAIGAKRHFYHRKEASLQEFNPSKMETKAKGRLVDCGKACYNHKPNNEESFFVTIQSKFGRERTFWGIDLPRALEEAQARIGDEVTLSFCGRQAVTISLPVKNDAGEIVDHEDVSTHRNVWHVLNHSPVTTVELKEINFTEGQSASVPSLHSEPSERAIVEDAIEQSEGHLTSVNVVKLPDVAKKARTQLQKQEQRRKNYASTLPERHQAVWDQSLPIYGPGCEPARRYFENRGFVHVITEMARLDLLRLHPGLGYFEEDKNGDYQEIAKYPTIIAPIRDKDGSLLTLHRIYLAKQGNKAPVKDAKKMMSVPDSVDINGGSIQLGQPSNGVLGVAEGLETALAAYRATGIPVWSTVNAQLMKSFEIPEDVHTLLIWADSDKTNTGLIAANILKSRALAQGVNAAVILPPYAIPPRAKSLDWNDVLMQQGRGGFPPLWQIKSFCVQSLNQACA